MSVFGILRLRSSHKAATAFAQDDKGWVRWLVVAVLLLAALPVMAQRRESAVSDMEVEKLRDTAYFPAERVAAFIDFLNQRAKRIEDLGAGKRRPGREEDLHDLMEQFTSIADDLEDNLDDYAKRHADVRKALPKVVAAIERWGTVLKTPPENDAYSVSRKLALETLADVRTTATAMIEEQKAWFLAHPPGKEPVAVPPRR